MITLRSAVLTDLSLLNRWDEPPHVVACDPDDEWNWVEVLSRQPAWREQLIAELHGRPIGCIQIIDPALEESHSWGDIGPPSVPLTSGSARPAASARAMARR